MTAEPRRPGSSLLASDVSRDLHSTAAARYIIASFSATGGVAVASVALRRKGRLKALRETSVNRNTYRARQAGSRSCRLLEKQRTYVSAMPRAFG